MKTDSQWIKWKCIKIKTNQLSLNLSLDKRVVIQVFDVN